MDAKTGEITSQTVSQIESPFKQNVEEFKISSGPKILENKPSN